MSDESKSAAPLVEAHELVKTFGPLRALDGLSLQIRRGEVVGLAGANGAGKSTLMRLLTGYLRPDGGRVRIGGFDAERDPLEVRRRIGYLPENAPSYLEMEVREFLQFVARMRALAPPRAAERIAWAVQACALGPKYFAPIGTLSRGYRQRVGIAQAILHDPDLLILDEPTSGLDPFQLLEIRRLIVELGRVKTVLFSTHIMQEVEAVCNRALVMHRGRLVADGSPAELKRRFGAQNRIVARIRGAARAQAEEALGRLEGVREVSIAEMPDRGLLECALSVPPDAKDAVNRACQRFYALAGERGWTVCEVQSEGVSLEDAFLRAARAPEQTDRDGAA